MDSTDFHRFSRNKFSDFQIFNFSDSNNIRLDNSQYVEIKKLCQSAKSEVKEISAFLCAFAGEKIMDAANHVHINFKFLYVSITFLFVFHRCDRRISTKFSTFNFQFSVLNLCYPEQFYLEYKRRAARDARLRIVAVSHLGRKIYLPFVADAHLLHRDDPSLY